MAAATTKRNGKPVPIGTAAAYDELAASFTAATGFALRVSSGLRTKAEQEAFFFARYRKRATGNGPFGDVRFYEGDRYVRVSAAGTVAVPGTSRHESGRALDVGDSGPGAGVETAGNARSKWLKAHADDHGFTPNGFGFGEPWHIEFTGDPWAGAAPTRLMTPAAADGPALVFFGVVERAFGEGNTRPLNDIKRVQKRLNNALHIDLDTSGLVNSLTRAAYLEYESRLVKLGFIPVANPKPTRIVIERLCQPPYVVK